MKNGSIADSAARSRRILRTSIVGIAANVLLAAFKAVVGLAANSVAVVLDAVNNLTDALSSVLTIVGVKLAARPPDAKHPFGYGRIEYFSAVTVAALVLAAGAGSLVESVKKIVHPEAPEYGAAALAVVAVAVIAKLLLGRWVSAQGRACNSGALEASGADALSDAAISAATLVGALLVKFAGVNLDGWLGAAISLFILKAGGGMLLEAVGNIMGNRPDAEVSRRIRETVECVPGVLGAYDLVLHNYGPDSAIGSVHVEIDGSLDASAAKKLVDASAKKLGVNLTGARKREAVRLLRQHGTNMYAKNAQLFARFLVSLVNGNHAAQDKAAMAAETAESIRGWRD